MKKLIASLALLAMLLAAAACGAPEGVPTPPDGNYLEALEIEVSDVYSGGGQKLGTRAEVLADKQLTKGMTEQEFAEYYHSAIEGSGHNWFTINFGDGTAIQFPGLIIIGRYGNVGDEGVLTETLAYVTIENDSVTVEYPTPENE